MPQTQPKLLARREQDGVYVKIRRSSQGRPKPSSRDQAVDMLQPGVINSGGIAALLACNGAVQIHRAKPGARRTGGRL